MTRDEVITLALQRLQHPGDTTLRERAETEIIFVQEMVLEVGVGPDNLLPWFLVSENLTRDTVAGEERLPLPTGFLREYEPTALFSRASPTADWYPLQKATYDELVSATYNADISSSGQPLYYDLVGSYWRLRPVPDAAYNMQIICYLRDAKLDSDIENRWLRYASDLVLAHLCKRLAQWHLRDLELAATFDGDIALAETRLWKENEARRHANQDYRMSPA